MIRAKKNDIITKYKQYEFSLETRKLEINLFWQRSLFFWGFIAASFIAFASLINNSKTLSVIIACFGFICSMVWTLANRGSKRWQENWESKVISLEKSLKIDLFSKEEPMQIKKPMILSAKKYSVSKLAIALSDFVVFMWFVLIIYSICNLFELFPDKIIIKVIIALSSLTVVAIYSVYIIKSTHSTPKQEITLEKVDNK